MIAQTALLGEEARPLGEQFGDGNRQLPFRGYATQQELSRILLRQGGILVGHDNRLGLLYRLLISLSGIGQGEERHEQLFLGRQLPQRHTLGNADGVNAADDDIVALQLTVDALHLRGGRLASDAEVSHRIIASQHLLEGTVVLIAKGQHRDLSAIELLEGHNSPLVLQQRDRLGIQFSGQPSGMRTVQPLRQAFQLDGPILMQSRYIFITEYLQATLLDRLHRDDTLVDRSLHGGEVGQGSRGSQQDIIAGQQRLDARIVATIGGGPFHGQRVGEAKPREAPLLSQQIGHHRAGKGGGRAALIQRLHIEMARHHTRKARTHITQKGRELHAV